jgi:hypothetical protein
MIFLINESIISNPDLLKLQQESDLDLFVWNHPSNDVLLNFRPEIFQSLSSQDVLISIKASLKESRNVLLTDGYHLPKFYNHDLKKQRLFIKNSQFIFFSPRASFFFKPPLVTISLSSFSEFEQLALKWGK